MTIRASDLVRSLEAANTTLRTRAEKAEQRERVTAKRIIELEAEIAALKPAVGLPATSLPPFGLTPSENAIFALLMAREIVSEDAIRTVLYAARAGDEPLSQTVHMLVSFVRRKLDARGYPLMTRRSLGWFIPSDVKARIRAALNAPKVSRGAAPCLMTN